MNDSQETLDLADFHRLSRDTIGSVETVIDGKSDVITLALTTVLAEGHLLIEDVPGVGKTMLARAIAKSVGCSVSRIQFTPDLLPSDITGVSVYNQAERTFDFKPGPVFANLVIGDEINRASPKTQSALLECMQEGQVTVDGVSYPLARPFTVVATQNPLEMEGTYPLPEAQRDRFMIRMSMGYPDQAAELAMLRSWESASPLDDLEPVLTAAMLGSMIRTVRAIHVSSAVETYAVNIARSTRQDRALRLGASPRATIHLIRAAKARAALEGRDFVLPDDIEALAVAVLAHRLVAAGAGAGGHSGMPDIVDRIVASTPVPTGEPVDRQHSLKHS
ncbi:MAG: AAA family ATPase [Microbacteriaceae bacterium]